MSIFNKTVQAVNPVSHGVLLEIPLPRIPDQIDIFTYNNGINDGTYNVDPVGQRISTDNSQHTKASAIIVSILRGCDIGEISYRVYQKYNRFTSLYQTVHEIIDGSHRSRSINKFISNQLRISKDCKVVINLEDGTKVKLAGLYYRDLPIQMKKYLNDYPIRMCLYDNINAKQAAMLFQTKNESTNVTHQEMLNSNSENLVAIVVRETTRLIPNHEHTYPVHELFSSRLITKGKSAGQKKPQYLSFVNKRLVYDEFVAIQLIYAVNNGLTTASHGDLENLYSQYGDEDYGLFKEHPDTFKKATADLQGCLLFLKSVGQAYIDEISSNGMGLDRLVMAARYYWWLKSNNPKFELRNPNNFAKVLVGAMNDLVGTTGRGAAAPAEKWTTTLVDAKKFKLPVGEPIPVSSKMREWSSGYHADYNRVEQTVFWLNEAMKDYCKKHDMSDGIIFRDTMRGFSLEIREQVLSRQAYRCWVSDELITLDNSEAAHIVSHADGGTTTADNCAMVRKDLNRAMGTTNAREWRRLWRERNGLDPNSPPAGER